jgi:DNA-binding transcriptional regulator YhcF (GntR family)
MAQQIKQLIDAEVLKVGEQLLTARELAIDLRINFGPVARVYRILDEEKLISTQRGRGTYIRDNGEQQSMLIEKQIQPAMKERSEQAVRLAKQPCARSSGR